MALKLPAPTDIRGKLVLAVIAAALVAMAAAGAGFVLFERLTLESRARAFAEPYAQIVSVGAETAVAFADAPRAQEILDSLLAQAQILEARIVLADGRTLARVGAGAGAASGVPDGPAGGVSVSPERNAVDLMHPLNDGARLHLALDLAELRRETRDTLLAFAAGAALLLGAVGLGLLAALQRGIVRPIATFAAAVDEVRTRADYTRRVPSVGSDELDRLGGAFNAMMGAIQQRDHDLLRLTLLQRTILDNVGSAIISTTREGVVTSFNPAAERLLGHAAEDVVGRLVPTAWHDAAELSRRAAELSAELGEAVEPGFEVFAARPRRGLPEERDWTYVRRDGMRVPVHLTVTALRGEGGRITGFVGLATDLSERVRAEEALRRHKDELEQTVQLRTAELRLARDAAEAANRAKSAFLANMSHEIRTPMNAILGMSELALRSGAPPQTRDYVRKAHAAAESLLGIVNDILDFSKIEAGRLDLECIPFELGDVLDDLVGVIGMPAEQAGLELLLELPPQLPATLQGDPSRLGQVLRNLGSNAVKFTEHGEVVVAVEVLAEDAASATLAFEVRDSGIGMSEEQRQRLFQPFAQGDASTSRRYGGTGLGLAICRQLVRLMGGELQLDSAPGRGSRFRFVLRFGKADAPAAAPPAPDASLRGTRVLAVDDHPRARELLVAMGRALGMEVDGADSAADALQRIAQADASPAPYELLLLDARMPGMDGVDCLRELARRAPLRHPLPAVLATTDVARDALLARLADAGLAAAALLSKPVTRGALAAACRTALGHAPAEAAEPAAGRPSQAGLEGARVLLVEDNEINREIALELLRGAGMQVGLAGDGREALDVLERERFDLVLMDCQMPVMDGYEATRALRRRPALRDLPVIAMTANAMVGDREEALAAGMDDHIAKPIRIDEMFDTLARWLARSRRSAA